MRELVVSHISWVALHLVLVSRCEQWKVLIVNVKRGGRKDHEVARAMRRLGRPSRSGRHVLWSESGRRSPPSGFERWTNRLPARSLAPCVRIDRLFARRSRSDTTGGRPSVHEDGAADRTTFRTNALPHYGWERVGCVIFNRQLPAHGIHETTVYVRRSRSSCRECPPAADGISSLDRPGPPPVGAHTDADARRH